MPISHTCSNCRRELGHIRAVPDPHYGLGVVVCPGCERAVVRTRHPDIEFWRTIRRTRKSLQRLFLVIMFTALATGAPIGMGFWLLPEITGTTARYTTPDFTSPEVPFQIGIALFMTATAGCIARAIVPHLRFPLVLGIFLALIAVFFNSDWLMTRFMMFVSNLAGADMRFRLPSDIAMQRRLLVFPLLIPPFAIGMAVGVVFNTMIERGSGRGIVRIRNRRRKRRTRLD